MDHKQGEVSDSVVMQLQPPTSLYRARLLMLNMSHASTIQVANLWSDKKHAIPF